MREWRQRWQPALPHGSAARRSSFPFPCYPPPGHPGFRPFWSFTSAWPRAAWAEHARKVENALRSGNAGEARHSVSMIVGRDTERMDVYGIARAAIESVAENLTDGVFSTLFWASAGCLAGGRLRGGFRRAGASCFQHPGCHVGGKKMTGTNTSAPLPHARMTRSTSSPHALFYRVFPFPP